MTRFKDSSVPLTKSMKSGICFKDSSITLTKPNEIRYTIPGLSTRYTHKIPTLKTRGPSTGPTPRLQGSAKYMVTVRKPQKHTAMLLNCSQKMQAQRVLPSVRTRPSCTPTQSGSMLNIKTLMDPTVVRSVGMGKTELLKRQGSCASASPALRRWARVSHRGRQELEARGGLFASGSVTIAAVKLFASQGCDVCARPPRCAVARSTPRCCPVIQRSLHGTREALVLARFGAVRAHRRGASGGRGGGAGALRRP